MQRFLSANRNANADEMTMSSTAGGYQAMLPKTRVLSAVTDWSGVPLAELASSALARLRRRRYNARDPKLDRRNSRD